MATVDRTIPKYQDGYEIKYRGSDDLYHCLQNDVELNKKNGSPAAFKSLKVAKNFMSEQGAQVVEEKPKSLLWTPPTPANIAPLAEQLAALPADAPRFVVIEKGYATYKEQGYAVYDRETQEIVPPQTYNGWNFVTRSKQEAEAEAVYRQDNPPQKVEVDEGILNALIAAEEAYQNRFSTPLPEPQDPLAHVEEVVFVGDQYTVGEIITDKYGAKFVVIEPSYYISSRDAHDAEDTNDVILEVGWHTKARRQKS